MKPLDAAGRAAGKVLHSTADTAPATKKAAPEGILGDPKVERGLRKGLDELVASHRPDQRIHQEISRMTAQEKAETLAQTKTSAALAATKKMMAVVSVGTAVAGTIATGVTVAAGIMLTAATAGLAGPLAFAAIALCVGATVGVTAGLAGAAAATPFFAGLAEKINPMNLLGNMLRDAGRILFNLYSRPEGASSRRDARPLGARLDRLLNQAAAAGLPDETLDAARAMLRTVRENPSLVVPHAPIRA